MDVSGLLTLIIVLLAIPAVVAFAVFMVIRRGLQMKKLAHLGIPITGKVLLVKQLASTHHSRQTRHWRLRYAFTLPDGRTFENGVNPSTEERQLQAGSPIDLVYLPADPQISATRGMVNLSRKALKLPPLPPSL